MNGNKALDAYKTNQTRSRADVASPYRLVKIMFENLFDNLSRAQGAIEQGNPAVRGECIGRSMDIINALKGALDHEVGGEVTRNLEGLYEYCNRCLFKASRNNDLEQLDQVISIIGQIKTAWDQLEGIMYGTS